MKTEIDYLKRFELSAGVLAIILAIYNLLLISSRIFVNKIYINTYPQDLLAFLDGVYRVHSGQIVHRDFSSIVGPVNFGLPAAFMSLNIGIISGVNYSEAAYVVVAFLIYLYIQTTRLDRMAGFFLGVWIPLALLARMNFGDPPQFVTEAMAYNRRCDVFLLFLLLLFIPAREPSKKYLVIDGVLYGVISAFLFYSKITFGLAALGLLPIMLIRKRDNITVIAVAAIVFLAIVAWAEIVYGMRFAWMNDIKMAALSSATGAGRVTFHHMSHVVRDNLPELLGLLLIPALILLPLRKLTISVALFCLYVATVSVLLVSNSAQFYVLTLPVAFIFVTLDVLKTESAFMQSIGPIRTRYLLLSAVASTVFVIESYPLALNIASSTHKAIVAPAWDSAAEILKKIVTDRNDSNDDSKNSNDDGKQTLLAKIDKMSALDAFAFARDSSRPLNYWDHLNMSEYADYLSSGIAAARQGCEDRARISTIDMLNPFSMLLGWPTGGGMWVAGHDLLLSKKAHLPDKVMFRDINCVMIPKLPVALRDRDGLLDIYGSFLSRSFEPSFESDMWTVLRPRAQVSDSFRR